MLAERFFMRIFLKAPVHALFCGVFYFRAGNDASEPE